MLGDNRIAGGVLKGELSWWELLAICEGGVIKGGKKSGEDCIYITYQVRISEVSLYVCVHGINRVKLHVHILQLASNIVITTESSAAVQRVFCRQRVTETKNVIHAYVGIIYTK